MVVPDKYTNILLPLPLRMLRKPDGGLTLHTKANESNHVRAAKPDGGLTILLALLGCSPCSMQSTLARATKSDGGLRVLLALSGCKVLSL